MLRTEKLRARRASRGPAPQYLLNFLQNFACSARLMHAVLGGFRSQEDLVCQAIRQYLIGVTSCLETFYRDLYVALLEADKALFQRVLEGDKQGARRLAKLRTSEPAEITNAELAAELAKFQNLSGIDSALSKVLAPSGYIAALDNRCFPCAIPSRNPKTVSLRLWPNWRDQFSSIFDHRHELVHDANKDCAVQPKDMAGLEAVALVVPQISTFLVAEHHGLKSSLLAMSDGPPAVLLVEDLISDDWHIERD